MVRPSALRRVLFAASAALLLADAAGAEDPDARGPIDPEAIRLLQRAVLPIQQAQTLHARALAVWDTVQATGQKLQFGSEREVVIRRPDRMFATAEEDDGSERRLYYDGEKVTLFHAEPNAFGQFPAPPTIDATLDHLELEIGAALPVADLFYSDLSHLGEAALEAAVVGPAQVLDRPCDHLALRGESLDWQIWVERDEPRVRKVLITYKLLPGAPQYALVFLDWEFGVEAPDERFEFRPPKGAERIPILVRPAAGTEKPR